VHNGTRILTETVNKVDLSSKPFQVFSGAQTYQTQSLIIATGATAKRMHVPGEERLWQKGISACAVCDGGLPVFRNKELVVIGGGDSALEEASYLTKFASRVFLVHRRDSFRASKAMQKRVLSHPKIEVLWNTVLLDVLGEEQLQSVLLQKTDTGEKFEKSVGGLFYAIGHTPNTSFLGGQLELDEQGYIKTKPGTAHTSIEGVFAAGDVQDKKYRQAITSAGTGCMAALEAEHYLAEKGLL